MATPRAISVGLRAVVVCLTPLLVLFLLPPGSATAAPSTPTTRSAVAASTASLDTTDRAAVAAAYNDVYLPAAAVTAPPAASDAATRCTAGTSPSSLQDATLALVNYVRQLSGVPTVTMNATFSASAQQAALMMYANGTVSPPGTGAKCSTDAGSDGLTHSNLSSSATGAAVVRQYMDDAGSDHVTTLRRSRLQKPTVRSVGSGTVGSYNALWVTTTQSNGGPDYTSWPSSGYFPAPLEPAGRWSFTPWNPDLNLSGATVSVTGPSGQPVSVMTHNGRSPNASLVFEVGTLPVPTGSRVDTYTVTVAGIMNRWGDVLDDVTYPVRLFDPAGDAPPPPVQVTAGTAPTVTGTAQVGQTLTAAAPTWSPSGVTTAYAWLRNGNPVSGATGSTYSVGSDDVGARMSVRATGTKTDCTPGAATSTETAAVAKAPASLTVAATSNAPGQAHLTVTVAADVSGIGGTVEVREGGYPVASAQPVTDGSATVDTTDLDPGVHTFTVVYSGDGSVAAATATATVTVADAISPGLSVRASSAAVGELALDVAVEAAGQPAAGGTVSVEEGATTLRSGIAVSAGIARYAGSKLSSGPHTLTVTYSGTSRVKASSTTITTTVRAKAKPTLTVKATSAGKGKVTVTVRVAAPGQTTVGGSLAIKEGSRVRKSSLVVNRGRATWSTSKVTKGKHTYLVVYRGTSQIAKASAKAAVKVR